MQIVAAELIAYRLPFATPWISAAGHLTERRGWLVRIRDRSGRCGHGDAAPLPAAGTETAPESRAWLDERLPRMIGLSPAPACRALPPASGHPAARCGLETALLDLQGKQQGLPLYRLLGGEPGQAVRLNAALGALDESSGERAAATIAAGFNILKLKLGSAPMAVELALLEQLCERLPAGVRLRLDANRAWRAYETRQLIERLNHLPIESLEEPLRDPHHETLDELQALARFDLALDESLPGFLQAGQRLLPLPVKRLIIKPACLGGLLPALGLVRQAHQQGTACVITSTLESSAGLWPLLHLAATADALTTPAVHGLATAGWFTRDLGNAPPIRDARVTLGPETGTGFILRGMALT
jgi:o-succinylbenzoate synthase